MTVSSRDALFSQATMHLSGLEASEEKKVDFSKEIKRKLKAVLFEKDLRDDIFFTEGLKTTTSQASTFGCFRPKVTIKKLDTEEETLFSTKRELALIYYHEAIVTPCATIIPIILSNFIAALREERKDFSFLNLGLALAVGLFSFLISRSYFSSKADDFAIELSNDHQLIEGGIKYLSNMQKQNQSWKVSLEIASDMARNPFNKINWGLQAKLLTKSGEERFKFFQPSIEKRMDKISQEIIRRKLIRS